MAPGMDEAEVDLPGDQSSENSPGPALVKVLLLPQHFQLPSLTLQSARTAGRQITLRVISLNVLNILLISSDWIYGNDLEKVLNS